MVALNELYVRVACKTHTCVSQVVSASAQVVSVVLISTIRTHASETLGRDK